MTLNKRRVLPLIAASSIAFQAACTQVVNPATGESQLTAMSPAEEIKVGKEQHPKILQKFGGAYEDEELQAYVEEIGNNLKAQSELPELDFTFTLLNSDVVNAFALPGGYVYISRGLMALAENEAEMAGVLAHEIGHVTARHSAQRYSRGVLAQGGLTLGSVLAGVFGGRAAAEAVQQLGGAGAQAYLAGYSREQEFQSDELGVRYLARAGYDPEAMSTFLEKLGKNTELSRKLAGQEGSPDPSTSWLSTHPRTPDRVARAAENAASAEGGANRTERAAYLRKIDGMIYGDDPAQGFVRGETFIHPDLRIAFKAPDGFRLQNTPNAVLGQNEAGQAMKFDAGRIQSAQTMQDYIAREWAKELKLQNLNSIQSSEIDGMEAVSAGSTARTQDGKQVGLGLAAIKVGADQVYRFTFISPGGMNRDQAKDFQRTVESFERLSTSEAAAFEPKRIDIVETDAGTSKADLIASMDVDTLPEEHFLVLNGLDENADIEPGSLVKVISE